MKNTLFRPQIQCPECLKSHFRALEFQSFLGQNSPIPPSPPKKRGLVDTVGYSIQTCWLLQFLLKPLPWLMNLQLFAHKLIKWLPWECVDWSFDNIMRFSLLLPSSMLKLPLMAEQECSPLIRSSRCYIQMGLLTNYIMEFPLPGTHILSDMCFSTQETHITSYGIECLSLSNAHLILYAPQIKYSGTPI